MSEELLLWIALVGVTVVAAAVHAALGFGSGPLLVPVRASAPETMASMTEPNGTEAALDVLYGAPLEAFVDERKRLARELRRGGDKAAAIEIAKWRKPSAAAWALNRVARDAPDVVAGWLAAGAELRDASARPAEVGGDAVRAAMTAHRSATSRLLDAVRELGRPAGRPLSEDMLDRARALLQAATTDAGVAELLRRGRIDEEVAEPAADAEIMPTAPTAGRERGLESSERNSAIEERAVAESERERAERLGELNRAIAEVGAVVEGLAKERARRVAAAAESRKRVEAARQALRRAEKEAEAAGAAVTEHDERSRAAQQALEELRAERESADG